MADYFVIDIIVNTIFQGELAINFYESVCVDFYWLLGSPITFPPL